MPTIPTYNAQRNIQPNLNAPPMQGEAAVPYENAQQVIGAVQKVTQAWSDAHDTIQATDRLNMWGKESELIESGANADTGIVDLDGTPTFRDNSQAHLAKIEKLKAKVIDGIDNQELANKLGQQFDLKAEILGIKIKSDFMKKEMAYNKATIPGALAEMVKESVFGTDAQRIEAVEDIKSYLNAQVANGLIQPDEAYKYLSDARKTLVEWTINNDNSVRENESDVLAELKDPEGKFSFLDGKDLQDMIEKSHARISQNAAKLKDFIDVAQEARMDQLLSDLDQGKVDIQRFDDEAKIPKSQGGLDPSTIRLHRQGYLNKIKNRLNDNIELGSGKANKKAQEFLDQITRFIDDETDRGRAYEILDKLYADQMISADEEKVLRMIKKGADDIELRRVSNAITGWKKFWRGNTLATEPEIAEQFKQFIREIGKGKNAEEMLGNLISEQQTKDSNNVMNGKYKEGDRRWNPVEKMWYKRDKDVNWNKDPDQSSQ